MASNKAYAPFASRDGIRGRSGLAYFCVASGSGAKSNSKNTTFSAAHKAYLEAPSSAGNCDRRDWTSAVKILACGAERTASYGTQVSENNGNSRVVRAMLCGLMYLRNRDDDQLRALISLSQHYQMLLLLRRHV